MTKIKTIFLGMILALGLSNCGDNNDIQPDPISHGEWSKTMKGNGEEIGAYPDLYSNYWEFTYNMEGNEDKAICLDGEFPYSRYFSISLYDDETGDAIGGINDSEIEPDKGYVNPFRETTDSPGRFHVYIVAEGSGKMALSGAETSNVCVVKSGVKRVAIFVRQYLGTDASGITPHEYGGVKLPAIYAIDLGSGKNTTVPDHVHSNVYDATSNVYILKSDEQKVVPFFLSPVSKYYPNNSTAYLYARTRLQSDCILSFSFIPAPIPTKPEQYADAAARYWSICLGSASDTRSYYSLCDRDADWQVDEKAEFIVCLKNNPRLEEIKARVEMRRKNGKRTNLFIWDSEKLNVDGKPLGEYIAIMYRNILPDSSWPHSIATMLPTEYFDGTLEPIDHVTDPNRQLAHLALGDYGPYGLKMSTEEFLKDF